MTKLLDNLTETIIIVLLAPIIILPEMAYFIGDRVIFWAELNYKNTMEKKGRTINGS